MKTRLKFTAAALLGTLALAACVPPSPEPTPVPSPTPTPMAAPQPGAAPPQVVTPSFDNWMDAPQTPGDWSYSTDRNASFAIFGTGQTQQLILACNPATRRIAIVRSGTASGQVEMLVRTETQDRRLTASQRSASEPQLVAELAASDPLLDAMAFSKGRFAVDVTGQPSIYVPAWPEVTRVIEDCRS